MPVYKAVVQYIQYKSDWKEVFYVTADNPQQALDKFDTQMRALSMALRHSSVYIDSVRVNEIIGSRSTLVNSLGQPAPTTTTITPDVTRTAALWTLRSSAPMLTRKVWLRGLNDADVLRNVVTGKDEPSAALLTAVGSYIAGLEARAIQIQALVPLTGTLPYAYQYIASATVGNGGTTAINMTNALSLAANNRVILSGFDPKIWPGLNGKYTARNPGGSTFSCNYVARKPPGTYEVQGPKLRVEVYRYAVISRAMSGFLKFGSRDTRSTPFDGRGARRAVRLRSR